MDVDPPEDRPGHRRDASAALVGAGFFSFALGIVQVAVPLLAVREHYSASQIGVLVAFSGVSQMGTRVFMGAMMRRIPDKVFVVAAAVSLVASSVVLLLSAAWPVFLMSQLLQGVARAFFWTGTQTHAVRMSPTAVKALARINFASGVGQIGGPLVAGLLVEGSTSLALAVSAAVGSLAVVSAFLLVQLPAFGGRSRGHSRAPVWRLPGVATACWAGASAGAWRGLLSSYVPVILHQAHQSVATIGVLVALANGAQVAGSAVAGRLRGGGVRRSLVWGVLASGLGLAFACFLAGVALLAGAALLVSGIGAGALQTVGPAMATEAVQPDLRGEAIASAGTFRAGALLAAPFAVAGLVTFIPLTPALLVAGLLIAAPAFGIGRLRQPSPAA